MFLDLSQATHKQKISLNVDRATRYWGPDDGIKAEIAGAFLDGMDSDASGVWVEAS